MKVTVSAPAKVILMGDHAVVYGRPALICTIDKRLKAIVSDTGSYNIEVSEGEKYIKHIIKLVCNHFRIDKIPAVSVKIISDIPIGYHLGSSAAVSVALVGALSYYLKKVWNPQLISQMAYESEKMIHINSSGVDPAAVTMGGLIWYRKELEFLRSIWQLPFKIPGSLNNFYLVDTSRPVETTGEMVDYVSSKFKVQSLKYRNMFDENENQTKKIALALKNADEAEMVEAIKTGEKTLEEMGVVSNIVSSIVRTIELNGGAAKILGGGGKTKGAGYLLTYHKDKLRFENLCLSKKWDFEKIKLSSDGVRLEIS